MTLNSDASAGETVQPGRQVTERRLGCGITHLAAILDSAVDCLSTRYSTVLYLI